MKKILDLLGEKGFVEGKDFTISEKVVTAIPQKMMVPEYIDHEAIKEIRDEKGNVIQEGKEAWQETKEVEKDVTAKIPDTEVLMLECLRTIDAVLIINDYLAMHADMKRPDDSFNLELFMSGGDGWNFKEIPKPSFEILYDMADGTLENARQEIINDEAKKYLDSTDWYVIRSLETGVKVPEEITLTRATMRLRHKKKEAGRAK